MPARNLPESFTQSCSQAFWFQQFPPIVINANPGINPACDVSSDRCCFGLIPPPQAQGQTSVGEVSGVPIIRTVSILVSLVFYCSKAAACDVCRRSSLARGFGDWRGWMIRRGRNGLLDDLLLVCHTLHLLIIVPAPLPARFAQPRISISATSRRLRRHLVVSCCLHCYDCLERFCESQLDMTRPMLRGTSWSRLGRITGVLESDRL
jgi:hypothetical protein